MYSGSRSSATLAPGPKLRTPAARSSAARSLKPRKSAVRTLPFAASTMLTLPSGSASPASYPDGSPSLATRMSLPSGVKVSMSGNAPTVLVRRSLSVLVL